MHRVIGSLRFMDNASERVGRIVSFLIFPITGVIIFDVLMRYVLRKSQAWAPETSEFLFGALFVLGGAYTFLHGGHVRMDAIYGRFSPRVRTILDLVAFVFIFLFCGVLTWKGWLIGWDSLMMLERSSTAWAPPVWPVKLLIPIGAGLFALQGLAKFIRDIAILTMRGGDEH